jgi:hypothetical protein
MRRFEIDNQVDVGRLFYRQLHRQQQVNAAVHLNFIHRLFKTELPI